MCNIGQSFDQMEVTEVEKEKASELAAYLLKNLTTLKDEVQTLQRDLKSTREAYGDASSMHVTLKDRLFLLELEHELAASSWAEENTALREKVADLGAQFSEESCSRRNNFERHIFAMAMTRAPIQHEPQVCGGQSVVFDDTTSTVVEEFSNDDMSDSTHLGNMVSSTIDCGFEGVGISFGE